MSKIRTAVVGLSLGMRHAYAYHHHAALCELCYVVDLNEELARTTAEQFGCNYATDWRHIVDQVDAISFATPHHLHYPMAMEAIAAGKHVLMEKPLANTEEESLKMIQAAEDQGVKLMVAFVRRFDPAFQRLQQAIQQEEYGKLINVNCWVEAYLTPKPGSWFSRVDTLGGGVLFSHGCHTIDILISMLGMPVEVAGLGTRSGTDWMEGEGTYQAVMKFAGGALGHLCISWGMPFKDTPAKMHLHATGGCFVLKGDKLEVITAEGRKTLYAPSGPAIPNSFAFNEVEHFLTCIRDDRQPLVDGREGLKSSRVAWALYAHQGTPIAAL